MPPCLPLQSFSPPADVPISTPSGALSPLFNFWTFAQLRNCGSDRMRCTQYHGHEICSFLIAHQSMFRVSLLLTFSYREIDCVRGRTYCSNAEITTTSCDPQPQKLQPIHVNTDSSIVIFFLVSCLPPAIAIPPAPTPAPAPPSAVAITAVAAASASAAPAVPFPIRGAGAAPSAAPAAPGAAAVLAPPAAGVVIAGAGAIAPVPVASAVTPSCSPAASASVAGGRPAIPRRRRSVAVPATVWRSSPSSSIAVRRRPVAVTRGGRASPPSSHGRTAAHRPAP
mmetsp:Transcript_62261/g.184167  ORF Transcript_62261/g.184167 Transcript_62261/m.184167 type:complete len:282 (-) Transcript_62261:1401-2246(-)